MSSARAALSLRRLVVNFAAGTTDNLSTLHVLDVPALNIRQGAHVGVTGPSGCGKTTFLHVLAGLERPTSGEVIWLSQSLYEMSEPARDRWRARNVGIVFQEPGLFQELTAVENVLVPVWLQNLWVEARLKFHAHHMLQRVGVRPNAMGFTLSRGEAQRVGLVRAVIRQPPILLADEPTASLDAANGMAVRDLLLELAREYGATLIVTTHDEKVAAAMGQRFQIHDARLEALTVDETVGSGLDESLSHP
jgi:putative ABC transport system ATP-binding protein